MTYLKVITAIAMIVFSAYQPIRNKEKDRDWLREYAFCLCYKYTTDDCTYFRDKDISLSVYREFAASYPESVFQEIDKMAKKAADDIKPSVITDHNGLKAVIKGCMTFYESEELKSFIESAQHLSGSC